jgi:hypothetical protein
LFQIHITALKILAIPRGIAAVFALRYEFGPARSTAKVNVTRH